MGGQNQGIVMQRVAYDHYIPSPRRGRARVGVKYLNLRQESGVNPHPNLPPARGKELNAEALRWCISGDDSQ